MTMTMIELILAYGSPVDVEDPGRFGSGEHLISPWSGSCPSKAPKLKFVSKNDREKQGPLSGMSFTRERQWG